MEKIGNRLLFVSNYPEAKFDLMILFAIAIFVVIIARICIVLIIYARWNYGMLEAAGIPVMKPTFFTGSVLDLHLKLYKGRTPIIHVCDLDLIRAIFVKNINHFYDRRVGHFGDLRIDEILEYLPGEKWKKMRKLQTILFSSGKIGQYSKKLANAAHDFVEYLMKKCDNNEHVRLDTRNAMDTISLDGIARASFGVKLENVEDPNNVFFRGLKRLLGEVVFPILHKVAPSFHIEEVLFDTFREIIEDRREQRRKAAEESINFPKPATSESQQPLLDTSTNKVCKDLADFLADCFDNLDSPEFKRLGISETTVLAQALNMINATMTMISYYLASNPHTQENKLYKELDEIIDGNYEGRIDNETIQDLPYLSACLNETCRFAPPLIRPKGCVPKTGRVRMVH